MSYCAGLQLQSKLSLSLPLSISLSLSLTLARSLALWQRDIRKLQKRTGKWKPTGINPYVVMTLYGRAERDLPAGALQGNPNIYRVRVAFLV